MSLTPLDRIGQCLHRLSDDAQGHPLVLPMKTLTELMHHLADHNSTRAGLESRLAEVAEAFRMATRFFRTQSPSPIRNPVLPMIGAVHTLVRYLRCNGRLIVGDEKFENRHSEMSLEIKGFLIPEEVDNVYPPPDPLNHVLKYMGAMFATFKERTRKSDMDYLLQSAMDQMTLASNHYSGKKKSNFIRLFLDMLTAVIIALTEAINQDRIRFFHEEVIDLTASPPRPCSLESSSSLSSSSSSCIIISDGEGDKQSGIYRKPIGETHRRVVANARPSVRQVKKKAVFDPSSKPSSSTSASSSASSSRIGLHSRPPTLLAQGPKRAPTQTAVRKYTRKAPAPSLVAYGAVRTGRTSGSISPPPLLHAYYHEEEKIQKPKEREVAAAIVVKRQYKKKGGDKDEKDDGRELVITCLPLNCSSCKFTTANAPAFLDHLKSAHRTSVAQLGLMIRCSCGANACKVEQVGAHLGDVVDEEAEITTEEERAERARPECSEESWSLVSVKPAFLAIQRRRKLL